MMLDTCNEQFDILYISIIIVQATVNVGLFYAWSCTRLLVELALAERDSIFFFPSVFPRL